MHVNSTWLEIGRIFLESEIAMQEEMRKAAALTRQDETAAAQHQPAHEAQATPILPARRNSRQKGATR